MDAKFEKVYPSPGLPFYFQKRVGRRLYFDWHYHHEYEITLIMRGSGQLFVGRNVVDYENLHMVLIGPDVPHAFASDLDQSGAFFESVIIQFSKSRIGLEHLSRNEFPPVYRLFKRARDGILFSLKTTTAVLEIITSLEEDFGLPGFIDLLKIIDLLSKDEEDKILYADSESGEQPLAELTEIEKVRQLVFQNYYEDISLCDAADVANLSVPSLCRLFRRTMNTTFIKYLNAVRINAACKSLIQTDMPINAICFQVGFNNLSNFNRQFSIETKQTPRQYRKRYKRKNMFQLKVERGHSVSQGL
ncbi:MAG: helix-turn-helix domain-containing protein [Spirochaetales bacterium]|nr:helix-turn-helix domain-containing protein [Spirochaetales bacterium]